MSLSPDSPILSIKSKLREVGLHSVIYGFGSIAQSAVQFLLIPVLTATLATAEFGAFSLIQMASVIAGSLFYLGMTSALPRSYFDYGEEHDRRTVFTTAFILICAGAAAQITLGYSMGAELSRLLVQSDRYETAVFWAFLASALSFVNQFFFTYLRFRRRSVASIVLSLIALVGSIGLSVHLLSSEAGDVAAPFQGIAWAQLSVVTLFMALYGREAFALRINRHEISVLARFGIPTVLTSIAVMAIDWADRILIERLVSIEKVGVYSVGYRLGSIVNVLVITPFTQIWNPMMIEYRSHANIGEFFSRMTSYYVLACSVVLVGACLFIQDMLPFLARSPEYLGAAPITLLIMAGYLVNGATNIVGAGLIYERRIFTLAGVYYAVAIGKAAVNLVAIPAFGIVGAAVVALAAYGVIPIAIYAHARRHFAIRFEWWRLMRSAAIVVSALLFGLFIDTRLEVPAIAKAGLLAVAVAALAVFCTDAAEKRLVLRHTVFPGADS